MSICAALHHCASHITDVIAVELQKGQSQATPFTWKVNPQGLLSLKHSSLMFGRRLWQGCRLTVTQPALPSRGWLVNGGQYRWHQTCLMVPASTDASEQISSSCCNLVPHCCRPKRFLYAPYWCTVIEKHIIGPFTCEITWPANFTQTRSEAQACFQALRLKL